MWQKIKDNTQIFTIAIISFFTFCAGLYHFSYWFVFGINGISITTFQDFIKSFIHPVCTGILGIVIMTLMLYTTAKQIPIKVSDHRKKSSTELISLIVAVINLISIPFFLYKNDPRIWLVNAVVWGGFFYSHLNKNTAIHKLAPDEKIRQYLIAIVIYLPIYSYCIGSFKGESISRNKQYDYCINEQNKDTLKYLGAAGDYIVFTSMSNSKNYFIAKSSVDTLVIYHFPK